MDNPASYPRRILLCVTGLSSQIVTETLYALATQQKPAFIPTEIHLITTLEGAERARLNLLSADPGWFHRFCHDYDIPPIQFNENSFHLLSTPDQQPLSDIRSVEDNEITADTILDVVRQLTADDESAVHASIAGGRKTMGFYLGYALSLLGRPQDRLSHVLVSSPFESNQQFYYPTRESRVIYTPLPEQRPLDTKEAQVTLAEIPFVRLRDEFSDTVLQHHIRFSDTVKRAQRRLQPPELVLDISTRQVKAAGEIFTLPPVDFAFLSWFARRALNEEPAIYRTDVTLEQRDEFLEEYRLLSNNEMSGEYDRVKVALRNGMDEDYLDNRCTHLKKQLEQALGKSAARPYLLQKQGKKPKTQYALALNPDQIHFAAMSEQDSKEA